MNITLFRYNQRARAKKALRTCATPNADKPISGLLIALVCALVILAAIALDAHRAVSFVMARS